MKRKDIQKAIAEAKSNDAKVREKVVIFENVLSFIFDISDRERCDYYDAVLLYICYGIVPNFAALSPTKAQQFRLLFSLLKKQRIGWENACKLDTSENLPTNPTTNPTPDQVYKDNKIRSIEDIKKEESPLSPPCRVDEKKGSISYTSDFEAAWIAYGRKGSKKNAFLRWKKLSDKDKKAAMIHIPYYLRTNEQQYLLDFEGYLNQRRFESPAVVKSTGQMLYDPDQGEQQSYNPDTSLHSDVGPSTDFGMVCKADRNPYTDTIRDGYTNDTRPDGALLYFKNGYDSHRWDAQAKVWRKVEGHWDVEQHKWIVEG